MVEAVHHLRIQRKATLGTMAVGGALHKYPNSAGDYLRHPLLLANWFVCHALTVYCGICVSSAGFFDVTSAKATFSMSRIMTLLMLGLPVVERTR